MVPIILVAVAVVVLLIIFFAAGYIKAPPDTAYIITGLTRRRILIGRAGFRIPFFERLDKLSLRVMQVDVKTSEAVPTNEFINVTVDGADQGAVETYTLSYVKGDHTVIATFEKKPEPTPTPTPEKSDGSIFPGLDKLFGDD